MSEIGRALGRSAGTVYGHLYAQGGIPPRTRRRSARSLTLEEREEISRGLSSEESIRSIARRLGRSPSTVSREVANNGGVSAYRATTADVRSWDLARRPKLCKLAKERQLRRLVASKLGVDWSPEQIANWLKRRFPRNERMHVSHETIYRSLFIQARGVLKKELKEHLRTRRTMRRSKNSSTSGQGRGQIVDAISIRDRPAEIEDRAVPGHWEGDLLSGSGNSHIATLVERRSRFTMLVRVGAKDSSSVVSALISQVRKLPTELRRSLTWDRGTEMAQHKAFSVATDVAVFFCDPHSPWQRGTNENTNRLLRQYFPNGTDLSEFSQSELNKIAAKLNGRPRKTLAFRTPAETFSEVLR